MYIALNVHSEALKPDLIAVIGTDNPSPEIAAQRVIQYLQELKLFEIKIGRDAFEQQRAIVHGTCAAREKCRYFR
jgi:hypothetical protein